jgi:hypothetical protein
MAFNQFFGTASYAGGSLKGAKGDKGDRGDAGPPYLGDHLALESDRIRIHKDLHPWSDLKADLGSPAYRFGSIYAKDLVIGTETIHIQDPGSEDRVSISYATKGEAAGRSNVAVKPSEGGDFSLQSVTTSRANPDKLDPGLMDISGLRFKDSMSTAQADVLDTADERYELQPGDYFVFKDSGAIAYEGFTEAENQVLMGDIVVFTDEAPERQFAKIPFRIPSLGVHTSHLAEGAVSSSKLGSGTVLQRHLGLRSVTSDKLEDEITVRGQLSSMLGVFAPLLQVQRNAIPYDGEMTSDGEHSLKFGPTEHGAWRITSNASPDPLIRFQVYDGVSGLWLTKFELDGLEEQSFE